MLKWWVYVIILIFFADVIYRTFFNKKIKSNNISNINTESFTKTYYNIKTDNTTEKISGNIPDYNEKNFDPDILHFYDTPNQKKIHKNNDDNENDDIVYPDNYFKNNDPDYEDKMEFGNVMPKLKKRINITIEYDESYQKLYEDLSKQLDGNFTYLSIYPKIKPGNTKLKILIYFIFGLVALMFIFIEKIISSCCDGMPRALKVTLSTSKYFFSGGCYLFCMLLIKRFVNNNIFEVYVDHKLKYSTIQKEAPPTYVILFNIIKNME